MSQKSKPVDRDILFRMSAIPIILFTIAGLFTGGFLVTILFRRVALALVFAGPMIFSISWIAYDWNNWRSKGYALGGFVVAFCITLVAFDREV